MHDNLVRHSQAGSWQGAGVRVAGVIDAVCAAEGGTQEVEVVVAGSPL